MSVFTFVEKLFTGGSVVTVIETELATAEKVAVNGLSFVSSMISAGATASEQVITELDALLPKVKTAVANAAVKAEGWADALKIEVAAAEAFIAARVVTAAAGVDDSEHGKVAMASFHIS